MDAPVHMVSSVLVLHRRTVIVLGALVVGMTLTSGLLLILEPGPVVPPVGITLQRTTPSDRSEGPLFETASLRDWQAIVIHDSGGTAGSYQTINQIHQRLGHSGNGYHFVINNGTGRDDGAIEMGFRWEQQNVGAYIQGQEADWYNRHAIGICLIGDTQRQPLTQTQLNQLIWLVQQLQKRFGIAQEAVFVDVGDSSEGVKLFPYGWFYHQLLDSPLP